MALKAARTLSVILVTAALGALVWLGGRQLIPPQRPTEAMRAALEGDYVTIRGKRIHYWKKGHGPPVVLIHGFGAWSFSWRHNIAPLSEYATVYTIDLLGFGLSDKPKDGDYSIEAQAELVAAFLEAMGIERAVLVGNSLGAEVAVEMASRYPHRVVSLVLIDSSSLRKRPEIPEWAHGPMLKAALRAFLINRTTVEKTLRTVYYNDRLVDSYIIDGYYLPTKTQSFDDALVRMAKQLKTELHTEPLSAISAPALIIWGRHDRIVPVKDAFRLKHTLAHAELEIIDNAGHAPQEEQPAEVNCLLNDFIKRSYTDGSRRNAQAPR